MRNASAKSLAMKAVYNNNLPTQTGDVIINPENPENPDSKLAAARIVSTEGWESFLFSGMFPIHNF